MEHRNGRRIKRAIHIELWRGDSRVSSCRSHDVGQGGLSLIGVSRKLWEGDLLTVKAYCGGALGIKQFERKAMVVYQSHQRLGLMWADVDMNFMSVLVDVQTIAA